MDLKFESKKTACPCGKSRDFHAFTGEKEYGQCFHIPCEHPQADDKGMIKMPKDRYLQAIGVSKTDNTTKYDYHDEQGRFVHRSVRYIGKDGKKAFAQEYSDGTKKIAGKKLYPYNLPMVLGGIENGDTIFIVEGEKDAETLKAMGYVATTNAMGAGKWKEEYNEYFRNADLVLIADNDEAGRVHVQDVARHLHGIAHQIRIVEHLQGVAEKGDITDLLQGKSKSEKESAFGSVVESAVPYLLNTNVKQETTAQQEIAVFEPTWEYIPQRTRATLTLNGTRIGSAGNLVCFVAQPGSGKSALAEAIVSSAINPECDSFGIKAVLSDKGKIAYLDTERSNDDSFYGWRRILHRAGLTEGTYSDKLRYANIRGLRYTSNKTLVQDKAIEREIHDHQQKNISREHYLFDILGSDDSIEIFVLDGLSDFIENVNDVSECSLFLNKLIAWANRKGHEKTIIATMHPNPNDFSKDFKVRGHLGSELQRRSESVLKIDTDAQTGIRHITPDFTHGKNRNADTKLSSYFQWSDEKMMFVSVSSESFIKQKEKAKQQSGSPRTRQAIQFIFGEESSLIKSEVKFRAKEFLRKTEKEKFEGKDDSNKALSDSTRKLVKCVEEHPSIIEDNGTYYFHQELLNDD